MHGENEKTIQIGLVNDKIPELDDKIIGQDCHKGEEAGSSGEELCDVIFKVKLEKPEP